jgi:deazaflavin-dependent oxidoreductase (nitroreductase family)
MTPEQAEADYGYLTTRGRITGHPHTIEIWFAEHGGIAYLLAGDGDRSDWCRNIDAHPEVALIVGDEVVGERARRVLDPAEQAIARTVVFDKYQARYDGDLVEWRDGATPYAVELA